MVSLKVLNLSIGVMASAIEEQSPSRQDYTILSTNGNTYLFYCATLLAG
jgi:hypothetical protein